MLAEVETPAKYPLELSTAVNSIYCSTTVNHRLTGLGKMVKLCLLFVGKISNTEI
jgi:hypothetical protein